VEADGPGGQEQPFADLAIGQSGGGHPRDLQLLRGEPLDTARGAVVASDADPAGAQFRRGTLDVRARPHRGQRGDRSVLHHALCQWAQVGQRSLLPRRRRQSRRPSLR